MEKGELKCSKFAATPTLCRKLHIFHELGEELAPHAHTHALYTTCHFSLRWLHRVLTPEELMSRTIHEKLGFSLVSDNSPSSWVEVSESPMMLGHSPQLEAALLLLAPEKRPSYVLKAPSSHRHSAPQGWLAAITRPSLLLTRQRLKPSSLPSPLFLAPAFPEPSACLPCDT